MEDNRREDIDLIIVFDYFKKLIKTISYRFKLLLLAFYFFLRQNFLIVIGIIIVGVLFGVLSIWLIPPKYKASVVLEVHKGLGAQLYDKVDYLKKVLDAGLVPSDLAVDKKTQNIFDKITNVRVEPSNNEIEIREMYSLELSRLDTITSKQLSFSDFKETLSEYSLINYNITLESKEQLNFTIAFNSLVNYLNSDSNISQIIKNSSRIDQDLLKDRIENIDMLDTALVLMNSSNLLESKEGLSDLSIFLTTYVKTRSSNIQEKRSLLIEDDSKTFVRFKSRFDEFSFRDTKERILKVTILISSVLILITFIYKVDRKLIRYRK